MGRQSNDGEKILSKAEVLVILLAIVGVLGVYFYMTFLYPTPCAAPPNLFEYSLNINKTADGWIIKVHGWLEIYNRMTGKYDKNYRVELSKLLYAIYNTSHFYEERYVSSIKNKSSPFGIIFYDVDNNNLLSDGDYMFIPMLKNSSNYVHSGDFVEFRYNGYITPTNTGTEKVKLP